MLDASAVKEEEEESYLSQIASIDLRKEYEENPDRFKKYALAICLCILYAAPCCTSGKDICRASALGQEWLEDRFCDMLGRPRPDRYALQNLPGGS
jgi:hypothetical protein